MNEEDKNMAEFDDLLKEFPEGGRETIEQIWGALPSERRSELSQLLQHMPNSLSPLKDILALVVEQYKPLGTRQRIAIVGPANVGKSTLFNQLISRKEDSAAVSPIPGTTRINQEADTGIFNLIDTPGADAVGEVGQREHEIALEAAAKADFLIVVFEATRGIKRYEKDLFDELLALQKPYIVLLNKIDLIPRKDRDQVKMAAARLLRLEPAQVIATVATQGTNLSQVILAVTKIEPRLLAVIAAAMPEYRARLCWQRIAPAAGAAGVVSLMPLPIIDFIPLVGIQSGLVLSIARIYGYEITAARAREIIATFGIGIAGRTLFMELSKLGGVPGWVLGAAIASSTTMAIGYAAMLWFSSGHKPSQEMIQKIMQDSTKFLRDRLMSLGDRRPGKGTLKERLNQAIEELPGYIPLYGRKTTGSEDAAAPAAGENTPE